MNSLKHETAFPTDFKSETALTPEKAKSLYPHKIHSKRNFLCSTPGCRAPLTCKSIDTLRTSSFVEGRSAENLHVNHCPFSHRQIQKTDPYVQEQQFETINTGNRVDHTTGLYFQPLLEETNPSSETTMDKTSSEPSAPIIRTEKRDTLTRKAVNNRLTKLHHFVTAFEENPDGYYINKQKVQLRIRSRFRSIHLFQYPFPEDDRFIIVYGKAYIRRIQHTTCFQIRFENHLKFHSHSICPTFLIPKDWVSSKYPFLLPLINKPVPFNAYIRKFPEITEATYINFKFKEKWSPKLGRLITSEDFMKTNTFFTPIV
ncbi:hypothetical protein FH000_12705 [Listeria monocytogenes]|nr:hypothetical protein [Listeria monocytogenes]